MKFQKYLIFNLWVCVTDSPRCVVASSECEYEDQQLPGLLPGGGARAVVERHVVGGGAGVGASL